MSTVCLSPNGVDFYRVERAPDDVLVATVGGVARVRHRGARWRVEAASLKGLHVSSLMRDPTRASLRRHPRGRPLSLSR